MANGNSVLRPSARMHRAWLFSRFAAISRRLPPFRGKTRLALAVYRALGLRGQHIKLGVLLHQPRPFRVLLDLHSWLQRLALVTGGYEADTTTFLFRLWEVSGRRGCCIDVGANIGLISIPLALAMREAGAASPCVVAVEAVPENTDALRDNVQLNALQDVVWTVAAAVGESEGQAVIEVEGDLAPGEGTGSANILPRSRAQPERARTLLVTTLDALRNRASRWPPCSVIKLDTDGYDLKALQGASSLLARDRPVVFGEFSEHCLDWHGQGAADITAFAGSVDYEVWQKDRLSWRFSPLTEKGGYDQDVLLTPRERRDCYRWCIRG